MVGPQSGKNVLCRNARPRIVERRADLTPQRLTTLKQGRFLVLQKAQPGTAEFRSALRDALEGLKDVVYSQGVVTMTKDDHVGQDKRARVMVTIENGAWKLLPEVTN